MKLEQQKAQQMQSQQTIQIKVSKKSIDRCAWLE